MHRRSESKITRRLAVSVAVIVLLSFCLAVTTFALAYSLVSVENNLFAAGRVKINLNNGKPVISENEFIFEPGMTVEKEFFLQNESTCDVYYKLYFQNVSGGLADVLKVRIWDGDKVLFEGTPAALNRESVGAADDTLMRNERRNLKISFHFPEEAGNSGQNLFLAFDFAADAVQTKNNTDKRFD